MSNREPITIYIQGPMGSGKSTAARVIRRALKASPMFLDLDEPNKEPYQTPFRIIEEITK